MTRPLNQEEMEAFTKELDELLTKHNAEIGVVSTIQLLKREDNGESETPKTDQAG